MIESLWSASSMRHKFLQIRVPKSLKSIRVSRFLSSRLWIRYVVRVEQDESAGLVKSPLFSHFPRADHLIRVSEELLLVDTTLSKEPHLNGDFAAKSDSPSLSSSSSSSSSISTIVFSFDLDPFSLSGMNLTAASSALKTDFMSSGT